MLRSFLLLSVLGARAFKLNALFTDGVILQVGRATVYGSGSPGEAIKILRSYPSGASDRFSGTADAAGFFFVRVADVAYGDVFLCSGQSNMFLPVAATFAANETMAGAWPNIRLFAVTTGWAFSEQADFPPPYNRTTEVGACGMYQEKNEQLCLTWQRATRPTIIGGFSATCFYTAINIAARLPPGAVLGLVHSSYVGTDMQTWSPPEALAACSIPPPAAPQLEGGPTPIPTNYSSLWNAMIHPIVRFGIRGVLWNQAEANMGWDEEQFRCLFEAMIAAWRARWAQPAGFFWGFVQLGTQPSTWPAYLAGARLGQSDALPGRSRTNKTAMAVAYDVGDHTSVHARNKSAVGERLAAALLHEEWGFDLPELNWAPPALASAALGADGDVTITFSTADGRGRSFNANPIDSAHKS